ncbi:MAG: M20/M25/M40 family metallo-hydrolase [Desulfobulbaceae bacterium]|nr:MAG: M20/M25/M40 family metallo-hydrolase [Desulfobulbaceae bacterium]
MEIKLNRERLAEEFVRLCEISSPPREEKPVADYLKQVFAELGADYAYEDDSALKTGSESGNLIFRFEGGNGSAPIFFACHMDTVQPGHGVQVERDGDVFTSRGETILGSDDKSGIAPLIELIRVLRENGTGHRPLELVFTTCEEIGLQGAKALDYQKLQAEYGYALDSTGIDKVIIGAPAANRIRVDVHGTAAHAGINPEGGVSAFLVAAQAITRIKLGRLDEESTANIGVIKGGVATNIVPAQLMLKGEIRSHSTEKLVAYTDEFKQAFLETIARWPVSDDPACKPPTVDLKVVPEYPVMRLHESDTVVETIRQAGNVLGREQSFIVAGGGSDANIFNGYGLPTAIVATGMTDVHTTDESINLNDMVKLTEMLYTIACM